MNIKNTCFVCKCKTDSNTTSINPVVNMPVCNMCKDTDKEKKAEKEALESLADGFVCGCI